MSGQCLGVAGSLNAHLECCLSEISHPRHIKIFHPVTLYQHRLDQYQLYFLDAEGQEKKQLVPFLFVLTFTTLRVKAADDNFTTFKKFVFLIFPGKQNWHFMQIASTGDNLHEIYQILFSEEKKKSFLRYRIRPYYRTYPYKRSTVKQYYSMYIFSLLLYKGICCWYSFELHRLVDAIQVSTHNICFYKENQK